MGRTSLWIFLIALLAAAAGCSGNSPTREEKRLSAAYREILDRYDVRLEKNRHERSRLGPIAEKQMAAEYEKLQEEKTREISTLGLRPERLPASSPLARTDRWEKARALLRQKKSTEALPMIRTLVESGPDDPARFPAYLWLALDAESLPVRREFTDKLLADSSWPLPIHPLHSQVVLQKALFERLSGHREAAESLLRKTLSLEHHPEWRERLQNEIACLGLIGKPAAALSTKTWLNAALPAEPGSGGEFTALLFWAGWSEDSLLMLGVLQELEKRYAAKGFQALGCTRLYGRTLERSKPSPPLAPDQEIRAIIEELGRRAIAFPVLVSPEGRDFDLYSIHALPTLVLIDRQGKMADFLIGSRGYEFLAEKLPDLLGE